MQIDYEFLRNKKFRWIVTGGLGFIGSNLVKKLNDLNQEVIIIDNMSTSLSINVKQIEQISRSNPDIRIFNLDIQNCTIEHFEDVDFVLHQAALGSVPRSLKLPIETHNSNVNGFINILDLSRRAGVRAFIYASSSSVYGDINSEYKIEDTTGNLLSPYAATKRINEIYAQAFSESYGINTIGLRYFNVFGPGQNPNGEYSAVIPRWINNVINSSPISIYGNGTNSRDFTYIDNVINCNILSAVHCIKRNFNSVYNVGCGHSISLNQLYKSIFCIAAENNIEKNSIKLNYLPSRNGDVKSSKASTGKFTRDFNYAPVNDFLEQLRSTFKWYLENCNV